LPESIGNLRKLNMIAILNTCKASLKQLPECVGNMVALKQLDLSNFAKLEELPASLGNLVNLQELDLRW
jgi:Leucine-rich repeat (LRR) protein